MSWTKAQIVGEAFSELGLHGWEFDLTADEKQTALRRLDAMLARWEGEGITLGYLFPDVPGQSVLSEDSGLPEAAIEPVFMNLAVNLAPGFGKSATPQTMAAAKAGWDLLTLDAALPGQQPVPGGMPLGAGWKAGRGVLGQQFTTPTDTTTTVGAPGLDFLG